VKMGRSGTMAAVVIQHSLDDVRRDADIGHLGGDAAPNSCTVQADTPERSSRAGLP